jgi:hypothetical protein
MRDRHHQWRGLAVAALLLVGFAAKGVLVTPPPQPPMTAAGEFDSKRALARLQRILGDQRPHPVDSAADDAVRERLIGELRAIGVDPQVRESVNCTALPNSRAVRCARVRNVVATLPGRASGRQLLLNAHYDSTPAGPGAGDDGIGVATLLEVASLLKASPPQRPVTFLFNEGEEFGLNGSSAFVRSDPLARQVSSLINIDARGVTGPAMMFETSDPNGAALSIYARAGGRRFANSLSTDFARLIPNTTDVVEFRPAGWTILNYAIIGNETRYHTPGDTVAALDRASLTHMGAQVLAATRAFDAASSRIEASGKRTVFTDIAGRIFMTLPLAVATMLLGLLLIAAVYLAWRQRAFGRPLLVVAAMTAAGCAAEAIAALTASAIRPGDFWRAYPLVTYVGLYALLLAGMGAVWNRWGRSDPAPRLRSAAWLLILVLGSALSLAVPGATIFFLIAPAIALIAIALALRAPQAATAIALVAMLMQFVMFAELLALIELLLVDGPLWAVAPLAALAALPALIELEPGRLRPALALLLVAGLGFGAAAMLAPRSSAERPAAFNVDYFRDADHNTASWGVATKQAPLPDSFPGTWRKGVLAYNGRTRWVSEAPNLQTGTAGAKLVANEPADGGRRLRIVLSAGGANAVTIRFAAGTKLVALGLPGQAEAIPAKGDPARANLSCLGRSCDAFTIEAVTADRAPVRADLFSYRFGLPPQAQPLLAARPRNAIPQYASDQTTTMKRVSF